MRKIILTLSVIVLIMLVFIIRWNRHNNKVEKQKEEQLQWVDECVRTGGRIERIGEWFENSYFVCYPPK